MYYLSKFMYSISYDMICTCLYVVLQAMLDVTAEQGWLVSVDVLLHQLSHDMYMFACCVSGYA